MSARDKNRQGDMLMQKMFELENAYKDINEKDKELIKYRKMSQDAQNGLIRGQDRDREITKLEYTVTRLEERMKIAKGEVENAKRDLKNEIEGRKVVEKKLSASEKDSKELRHSISSLRVKLGVANANSNVGKKETDELRRTNQEYQIQIARLEERLVAASQEIERHRDPMNPTGNEEIKKKVNADKKESKKLRAELERMQDQRESDQKRLIDKEVAIRGLQAQADMDKETITYMERQVEVAENNLEAERHQMHELEEQNLTLRNAQESFDETIREYKVKLGISTAKKNVNVRQADELRKKDEEYQQVVRNLEKRIRLANIEIEKLKSNNTILQKTADSSQNHSSRFKKHRSGFGMEFTTPRPYGESSALSGRSSGWSTGRTPLTSPLRSPQRSPGPGGRTRISITSVNSLTSHNGSIHSKTPTSSSQRVKAIGSGGKTPISRK